MSKNKLKEIADKFTEQISKIDLAHEKEFINDLLAAVETPKTKIPEPVFREIFLPYFIGEKAPSRSEDAIAHWIGLVGSASEAAEVVNVKGEVLFEVPPMYDTTRVNTVKDDSDKSSLGNIFTVYAEQAVVHRALGNRYLAEELAKKTKYIDQEKAKDSPWKPALKYYKMIDEDQKALPAGTAANSDDDLEFTDD